MTHYIHNMRKVRSWQRHGKRITFAGLETKAHQSCMPRHLCLGCIGAISSDSVALFVSHCNKVFWLNTVIILPDRKESFFSCPSHVRCVRNVREKGHHSGETRSTLLLRNTSGTPAIRSHLANVQLRSILQQITNCSTTQIVSTFCQVIIWGKELHITWPLHAGLPWIMALPQICNSSTNASLLYIWIMFSDSHIGFCLLAACTLSKRGICGNSK